MEEFRHRVAGAYVFHAFIQNDSNGACLCRSGKDILGVGHIIVVVLQEFCVGQFDKSGLQGPTEGCVGSLGSLLKVPFVDLGFPRQHFLGGNHVNVGGYKKNGFWLGGNKLGRKEISEQLGLPAARGPVNHTNDRLEVKVKGFT